MSNLGDRDSSAQWLAMAQAKARLVKHYNAQAMMFLDMSIATANSMKVQRKLRAKPVELSIVK